MEKSVNFYVIGVVVILSLSFFAFLFFNDSFQSHVSGITRDLTGMVLSEGEGKTEINGSEEMGENVSTKEFEDFGVGILSSDCPAFTIENGGICEIYNWTGLNATRECLDCDYVLMNDLSSGDEDYGDIAGPSANDGDGFEPIGNVKIYSPLVGFDPEYYPFNGTFDGDGYNISNLYMNRSVNTWDTHFPYTGLFGLVQNAEIKNLGLIDSDIFGSEGAGGIAGIMTNSSIVNSFSKGKIVSGYRDGTGGLVGGAGSSNISNSHSDVIVISEGNYSGGLAGLFFDGKIENSFSIGNVSGDNYVGGLAGLFAVGKIENSSSTGNVSGDNYVGGLVGQTNVNSGYYYHSYVEGFEGSYSTTGEDMVTFFQEAEKSVSILNQEEESLGTMNFIVVPIPEFHFILNSDSKSNVSGNDYVGGLVGRNSDGIFFNTSFEGNVSGFSGVGGLIGYNLEGKVLNSSSTGNVDAIGNFIGGLIGWSIEGTTSNSFFEGNVTGQDVIGGLAGALTNGSLFESYSLGSVFGVEGVGGLAGMAIGTDIFNSYSLANVGAGSGIGGLIGVGGDLNITNTYSAGFVDNSTDEYVGGLIGNSSLLDVSIIENSFWDVETSGQTGSDGGVGRTTEQMKDIDTFSEWDIEVHETKYLNEGYPFLSWQVPGSSPVWYISEELHSLGEPFIHAGDHYNEYFKGEINLSSEVTKGDYDLDENTCEININNSVWTGTGVSFSGGNCTYENYNPEANFNISFRISDVEGNWEESPTKDFIYDIDAPTTEATPPRRDWDNTVVVVSLTADDGVGSGVDKIQYCWEDGDTCTPDIDGSGGSTEFIIQENNGNWTLCHKAVDNLGNVGDTTCDGPYKVDKINPSTEITSPDAGEEFNYNFSVEFEDSDYGPSGLDYCEYRVLDDGEESLSWSSRTCSGTVTIDVFEDCVTVGENKCTVESRVFDNAGNSANYSRNFSRLPDCPANMEGFGNFTHPCEITNWTQLQAVREVLYFDYVLMNNLNDTLGDFEDFQEGNGFEPLGNFTNHFVGNFIGQNKTISNLYINRSDEDYVGLFGFVSGSAEVENLGLTGVRIIGNDFVGGFAGSNEANILGSYVTGYVAGNNSVGGFVGYSFFGDIQDSYSLVNVAGNNSVGGFVGYSQKSSFNNSYSAGFVNGTGDFVGGFLGEFLDIVSIENSFWDVNSSGKMSSEGDAMGKTTAEMISIFTFNDTDTEGLDVSWDIIDVPTVEDRNLSHLWNIVEDKSYPFFSWQDEIFFFEPEPTPPRPGRPSRPDPEVPYLNWYNMSVDNILAGEYVKHSVVWMSNVDLMNYTFSFDNGTGEFESVSSGLMSGDFFLVEETLMTNFTVGTEIRWKVYASDFEGKTNVTDIHSYVVKDLPTIVLANPDDRSNFSESSVTFEFKAFDTDGVSKVVLFGNWSGRWKREYANTRYVNDTWVNFTVENFTDGNYMWSVSAVDFYDNIEFSPSRIFKVELPLVPIEEKEEIEDELIIDERVRDWLFWILLLIIIITLFVASFVGWELWKIYQGEKIIRRAISPKKLEDVPRVPPNFKLERIPRDFKLK